MDKKPINVLITAASRRVALIRTFREALRNSGNRGRIIACDVDPLSAGLSFCDSYELVPLSSAPNYIKSIKKLCKKENISLLISTIDEEIPLFGRHKSMFEKIGVKIPGVNEDVANICNDKYKTYLFFKKHGLPIAETYLPKEIKRIKPRFPLFIKPRMGRGAVGAFPVKNRKELDFFLEYVPNPVIQTFLPGKEYTIDVLCDFDGKVVSVVPRQRLVIRSGVSDRGRTHKNKRMIELAKKVATKLGIIGPANLQCKVYKNKTTFFEVNPRFSGAIQLTIKSGADFPKMILQMLNNEIDPCIGEFEDKLTMVSYEESIYHPSGDGQPFKDGKN